MTPTYSGHKVGALFCTIVFLLPNETHDPLTGSLKPFTNEHVGGSVQVEYAGQGQALWTQLEAAVDQAAYINSEEHLFDQPKSEWPRIAQLQKELQPYLDLWVCSR